VVNVFIEKIGASFDELIEEGDCFLFGNVAVFSEIILQIAE
jgi:hypothetical protein